MRFGIILSSIEEAPLLEVESILSLYDANEYYEESILPKINALDGTG